MFILLYIKPAPAIPIVNGYERSSPRLHCIHVKSHGFAVSLTMLAMKSRSHADYVISHAFQLKQNIRK